MNLTKYKVTATFIIDDKDIYEDNSNNVGIKFCRTIYNELSVGNIELTNNGITHWFYQSPNEIVKFDKVKIEKI